MAGNELSKDWQSHHACVSCGALKVIVTDSRVMKALQAVRRRRMCGNCNARWTTYEITGDKLMELNQFQRVEAEKNKLLGKLAALLSSKGFKVEYPSEWNSIDFSI